MSSRNRIDRWARRVASRLPPRVRERLAAAVGRRPREPAAVDLLLREVEGRIRDAVLAHESDWGQVDSLPAWERFREARIEALGATLDPAPARAAAADVVSSTDVDGVVVENLVHPVRDGMPGFANLYRPRESRAPAPAIVVVHSHHTDATHRELREMGVRWARAGTVVVVPTLSGHGARRLHPFAPATADDRVRLADRQDYYFRYNLGLQLALAGRSLLAWFVDDVVGAIEVVAGRPEVDRGRVVVLGSVAGGGHVAATVAALDRRVAGLVCFGYGPGPDLGHATPGLSPGTWETSRSPARVAIDGFLPWVVLGSIAPRPLLYAHEFEWSADRDPVWRRLRKIYGMHGVDDHLAAVSGRGSVDGPPPDNTHCTHVGRLHRESCHPVLERWFGIVPPDETRAVDLEPEALRAGAPPIDAPRALRSACGPPGSRRAATPADLRRVLGARRGDGRPAVPAVRPVRRIRTTIDPALGVGFELRMPRGAERAVPVVVGVGAHDGRAIGRRRAGLVRALLRAGCAVALADPRGCGPSRAEAHRGRHGRIQAASVSEWMLDDSLPGRRLGDLARVLDALAGHPRIDAGRIVLWGESIAPARPDDDDDRVRFDAGMFPAIGEPAGGWLALAAGVLDDRVRAVVARGTLASLASVLDSPFCFVPMDWIAPGMLPSCETADLVAALAPRAVYLDGLIDGRNRTVPDADLASTFRTAGRRSHAHVAGPSAPDADVARWIVEHAFA